MLEVPDFPDAPRVQKMTRQRQFSEMAPFILRRCLGNDDWTSQEAFDGAGLAELGLTSVKSVGDTLGGGYGHLYRCLTAWSACKENACITWKKLSVEQQGEIAEGLNFESLDACAEAIVALKLKHVK